MNYKIISSSSKGNCITVNDMFMLDCGVNYSKIKDFLKQIKIIFISHQHSDHLKPSTIKKIAYEYPTIKFVVGEQLVDNLLSCGVSKKNIYALKLETWYNLGICKIKLDYLKHDVPNYALHLDIKGHKIIYIVDTKSVKHIKATNYDFAFIEGNYLDEEELNKKIEQDKFENKYSHYERVRNTHLSQLQAYNWLVENNVKDYIFIHQHYEKGE